MKGDYTLVRYSKLFPTKGRATSEGAKEEIRRRHMDPKYERSVYRELKDAHTKRQLRALDEICERQGGIRWNLSHSDFGIANSRDGGYVCRRRQTLCPTQTASGGHHIEEITSTWLVGSVLVVNSSIGDSSAMTTEVLYGPRRRPDKLIRAFTRFYGAKNRMEPVRVSRIGLGEKPED